MREQVDQITSRVCLLSMNLGFGCSFEMEWSVDGFVGDVEKKDVIGLGYAITKIS